MFEEQVVLITGASSGIGAETAEEFARLGARLALTARRREHLARVAAACRAASPRHLAPLVVPADVTDEHDVERIIATVIREYGKLNVLVNNAGILESGSIETTSLEQYDRVMNTNVRSVYQLTMLAAPHLARSGAGDEGGAGGCVVNVSSVTGLRAFPNVLAYCVSKAALDQLTRCVALELAPKGVRVNAVNPGVITTGIHMKSSMSAEDYEQFLRKCAETHALGRAGEAREVAAVITFLASAAASNVTGATLPVDGGRHAMCPR